MDEIRLKIAIQKSGRLAEPSLSLLEKCGIKLQKSKDQLFCKAENFALDVLFVRDDDIPSFVAAGVCQAGIVGSNVLIEKKAELNGNADKLETLEPLGFGKCRLSLAAPESFVFSGAKSLEGKTIATSYRAILSDYLKEHNVSARIISMSGAVEIAPRMKMADMICDLVSTGATLAANGLKELDTVFRSEAVLIKNNQMSQQSQELLDRLLLRMKGQQRAEQSKYIMLHAPIASLEAIKSVLPGSESPTIVPIQGCDDKVALHAVCNEGVFWNTMEALKQKGASAILVVPIEKMLD